MRVPRRRKPQHGGQWLQRLHLVEETGEGAPQGGELESQAEAAGIGQDHGQHATRQPVGQRPLIGLLDVDAGMVDQMHVVDAGGTSGRAGETGEAAVDMGDDLLIRRTAVFEHVLDQIDSATRAIEFVAKRHIGRTGGGAETAMHAFAQNGFRFRDMGIGELFGGEIGLHAGPPRGRSSASPLRIVQIHQLWGRAIGSPAEAFCRPMTQRTTIQIATPKIRTTPMASSIRKEAIKA